jgi:hippurate hydrolase
MVSAPKATVSAVYGEYPNWPRLFPTINGVRLLRREGAKLVLEIDHAEGTVVNEMLVRSPDEISLWEVHRRFDALFVNRFETVPEGTRFTVSGEIHLKGGPEMASTDVVRITVRGRGGHASAPHTALDPITVAAEIVIGLQTMVTRRIDVFDPAVVTIAQIQGGTTNNIIPDSVFLFGTIRTVSDERRAEVRAGVQQVAEGIAAAHGATAEVDLEAGYPITVNDPEYAAFVTETARSLIGDERVKELPSPIMGAEDFSYVLQQVPGAMAFLGGRPADVDEATAPQNHSNLVVFDEDALPVGVAMYGAVAIRHAARG